MTSPSPTPTQQELRAAFAAIRGIPIPTVPDILTELHRELRSEAPDTERISALVGRDQAVTGLVLKTINSPAFGLAQEVDSIHRAVVLLGLATLQNLVLGALAQQQLQVRSPLGKQIWHDSLETARAAMHIATLVNGLSPDEAYLVGLLHDCGALLMAEKWPGYAAAWDLRGSHPIAITATEVHRFGTHHAVVSYLFAQHWKLSETLCQAIYLHHQVSCAGLPDSHLRALVATLKMADVLVSSAAMHGDTSLEQVQFLARARNELMLERETVEQLRQEAALGFE